MGRKRVAFAAALVVASVAMPLATGSVPGSRAATPAPAALPAKDRPDHGPIEVLGDADLIAPDTPADDDGIRGGSGTEDDPYIISNWRISSDDEDGIYVFNTSLHLVIRDVTLTQDVARNDSYGIYIDKATNVVVENVTVRGRQSIGIVIYDVHPDRGALPGDPVVLRDVQLRKETVRQFSHGIRVQDAAGVVVDGANVTGVYYAGMRIFDAEATVRDSYLDIARRDCIRYEDDGDCNLHKNDYYFRGMGIEYDSAQITIRGNRFLAMPYFIMGRDPYPASDVRVVDNRFVPSGDNLDAVVLGADDLTIRNNTGFVMYDINDLDRRARLVDNEFKHVQSDGGNLTVRDNVFDGLHRCRETASGRSTVPQFNRQYGYGCRIGLVASGAHTAVVEDNIFKRYPTTPLSLRTEADSIVRNNTFYDSSRTEDCAALIYWTVLGGSARLTDNDLLRSPADECGLGLTNYVGGGGQPSRRERSSVQIEARGNYWGPEPPVRTSYDEEGELKPVPFPKLAFLRYPDTAPISLDPATTPNVLSDSFVRSYFANDGGLLPGPSSLAILAALALTASTLRRFTT